MSPFSWEYDPYKPEKIIYLDINLRKIILYNGKSVTRLNTRFIEALRY